ncbi:envelope stress response membrane protein PspC [Croceicoccus sp. F390]|uniref:Envelope stress response membrane protein PspC n=1 Tax=Croceicoccus esteveae TaxID=3075597 RepID=A0ABU2ZI82_9SPHN|nr:envelope stress response membrane protein PspC [Croceicoccus sp. F390]MDT0576076.1 envelope stress response membrane protein PspC [Croceicoccus sp. F390]
MTTQHTRFYRDKVDGKVLGVCSGIADYTGVDAFWVRLGFVLFTITMGWPLILYMAMGMLAPKKPARLYADAQEQKFWQGVRQSPSASARDVKGRLRDVDRRLARVEEHYVDTNRTLAQEIEKLR